MFNNPMFNNHLANLAKDNTHLYNSPQMKEFESIHAVSKENQRYICFGAVLSYIFGEPFKVFNLMGHLDIASQLQVLNIYKIESTEDAKDTLSKMSEASLYSRIAKEIYDYFVVNDKYTPLTLESLPNSIDGLQSLWENSLKNTIPSVETYLDQNKNEQEEDINFVWHVYAQKHMVDRINSSLKSYTDSIALLEAEGLFKKEYLESIAEFAAFDLGRVVYIARLCTHIGFSEEEFAWHHIKIAAKNASLNYDNWSSFLASYVLGRALSIGEGADSILFPIKFLLGSENSPWQKINFKSPSSLPPL